MSEGAVRDHVDTRRVEAGLCDQAVAAVVRVRDDRIEVVQEADLGRARAGDALARQDVVGGEDERAPPREQVRVQRGDREPLEVNDVGLARAGAVAEHVRDVRSDASGARAAMPVEELASLVAGRCRRLPMTKLAREKLRFDAAGGEAGRERMVVGRGVRGGVDDVDLHLRTTIGTAPAAAAQHLSPSLGASCGLTDNVGVAVELTYCICNTDGRQLLLRSIAAVEAERAALPFATELLVLDNGSDDGSAAAVRELGGDIELIEIAAATVEGDQ